MHVSLSGGLLVAENASDERSVGEALRRVDDDLRLVPWEIDDIGRTLYKVYKYLGPNHPAAFICAWTDDYGEPLPLSHRLVDKVNSLRPDSYLRQPDPDEVNERLRQERLDEIEDGMREISEEFSRRAERGFMAVLHRGQGLRRARDRTRWLR